MKTIFSGIINFIIVIIVTLAIFATFLFLNTNENGIVTVGDGSIIAINDESMNGTLDKGDLIVVYKQSIENIVENDVVTYLYEENKEIKILTGRVYLVNQEENQTNLVLKGDAESEEEIVTINATNIIGKWNNNQKMVFVGSIYNFILSPTGFIIVITVPLIMLLGYVVVKLAKKQKKNKKNTEDISNEITSEEAVNVSTAELSQQTEKVENIIEEQKDYNDEMLNQSIVDNNSVESIEEKVEESSDEDIEVL